MLRGIVEKGGVMAYDVVVVEDDDDLRSALVATIAREGLRVCGVGGVATGLVAIQEGRPKVVLMDLMLGSGTAAASELVRRLRADAASRDIPIILVSGVANASLHARRLGAAGWLKKPFSARQLLEVLRPWCERFALGSTPPVAM